MKKLSTLRFLGFLAAAFAFATSATAQTATRSTPAGPFVDISVDGPGVVLRPERVRYRVTADPGSYVTVFLISPTGRVSLLNPYERAIAGSHRREILREASTGFASGESYLVAVATRNAAHSSALIRLARNETRLAAGYYTAETSMDELVTNTVRRAGDDFSVAYASFRLLAGDYPTVLAYNQSCPYAPLSPNNVLLSDVGYRRSFSSAPLYSQYDQYGNQLNFLSYAEQLNLQASCNGQTFQFPFFLVRAPAPSNPMPPRRDTSALSADSIPKLFPPIGPKLPLPFNPDPRNANPGVPAVSRVPSLRIDPVTSPSMPLEAGTPTPQAFNPPQAPLTQPVPVTTEPRAPIARIEPPRIDPVPVQMDRPATGGSEPSVQWQRSEPQVQSTPVMQPMRMPVSPPPPPSPPPPRPSPTPQPVPVIPPPAG